MRSYSQKFDEDLPPLARIKKLGLATYRKVRALRSRSVVPAYAGDTTLLLQIYDLRRAQEAAEELAANLAQRIRALQYARLEEKSKRADAEWERVHGSKKEDLR